MKQEGLNMKTYPKYKLKNTPSYKSYKRTQRRQRKPSIAFPVLIAALGAIGLCYASQSYDATHKPAKKTKEVVLIKQEPLPEAFKKYSGENMKAIKRANNNMTKKQRDEAFAELFASK